MARRRHPLIAGGGIALAFLASALAPLALHGQTATPVALSTPAPNAPLGRKKNPRKTATPAPTPSEALENVRKALEALTPEQRQQFRDNLVKWMNLPPDDKKVL